jgi:hypothetical protein
MYALLLEVLYDVVVYTDLCIDIDINKIMEYVWGRNL